MTEAAPDTLLSVKEYAALFRVTVNAVYTAIRRDKLPYPIERPLGKDGSIRIRIPAETIATLRAA